MFAEPPISNKEKVKRVFDNLQITKWVWKAREHSVSLLCNNWKLWWQWVFYIEEIWDWKDKLHRYLVYQEKEITAQDFFKDKNVDFSNFEWYMWIDIATWVPFKVNFVKQLHTLIWWVTWSWKSVTLYFILYQLFQNKYTEFYILDKNDFWFLAWTWKVVFRQSALKMDWKWFFNFIQYFWLEQDRRNKIFTQYWVRDWSEYAEQVMWKVEWAPVLNYIYILMDEYQSLRKIVSETIWEDTFDNNMKKLLDTVRAAWMCFLFWSQDYQKKQIWDMRDSIRNNFIWKMWYCDILSWREMNNIKSYIEWTFLFYHTLTKKFLKIPFVKNVNEVLMQLSNEPKNRLKENNHYDRPYQMLNDLLDEIESDIFLDKDWLISFLKLDTKYMEKLKNTSDYLPFMVLIYILWRWIVNDTINRTFNIFSDIHFEKEIDTQLFTAIQFFKGEDKFLKLLQETFEASWDRDEFIEKLSDVLNFFLKNILWATKLVFNTKKTLTNIIENPLTEEEQFLKSKSLLEVSYTWDIKPQSVNSMYFIDKNTDKIKKSFSADTYEDKLKNLIVQRMMARSIPLYKDKIIVDLLFEIEINKKKDWNLSKSWRIDLDNLMKATIDSISKTIIKDDNLVYWIRAKIKYKPKDDNIINKNNKVKIKVYPFEEQIISLFNNWFQKYNKIDDFKISIDLNSWISIPSYNNMYNIIWWKKVSSANTESYKSLLKRTYYNSNQNDSNKELSESSMALTWIFWVYEDNIRDLDNMLKATIDSFTWTIYKDDKQILEFFVLKKHVDGISWSLDLSFFEINDDSEFILNRNNNEINEEEWLNIQEVNNNEQDDDLITEYDEEESNDDNEDLDDEDWEIEIIEEDNNGDTYYDNK